MAPPVAPLHGFSKYSPQFSLGFFKPYPNNPFGHPSSFGSPGTGGSFGFGDPEVHIGYGYVLNGMGTYMVGSKRHRTARSNVSLDRRDRSVPPKKVVA
jgi:hypothetical protein